MLEKTEETIRDKGERLSMQVLLIACPMYCIEGYP